ncbi:AMP-binding protein [soil metagenome]
MRVIDLLDNGMRVRPDGPCVVDASGSLTHAQVRRLSIQVANGLRSAGVAEGARVAVYSPNSASAFVAMIGLFRAGAVWLPIGEREALATKIEFLAENDCEFLFYDSHLDADVQAMRSALPRLRGVLQIDGDSGLQHWASAYPDRIEDPMAVGTEAATDRLAWVKGTGGTTGRPKSVQVPERAAQALFASFHLCMPLGADHVNLVAVPLTHGAGNIALSILFAGGTNVLLGSADVHAIFDAIERHRVTTLFLPPTVIYRMLATPGVRDRDFSSLRYFIYAAAPMSAHKLEEAIEVFGPVMAQCWGQTEAPLLCTFMSPRDHEVADDVRRAQRMKSCGRPSPLTQVEIMDDEGALLGADQMGELVVRGDLVMAGYHQRPDENEAARRFGWHHTGDVGYRDSEGFFYIVDRKKDMIISGGFNIYPSEIEQVLWRHPSVMDCAVIGVPDQTWGEAVKAVVELKSGLDASTDELRAYCRDALGGMKTPKSIEIWDVLPRSAVGKVLKREIRERYWAGQARRV